MLTLTFDPTSCTQADDAELLDVGAAVAGSHSREGRGVVE